MNQSKFRRLNLESLEHRSLMAADLHNLFNPLDVNDDGRVAVSDALSVVSSLSNRANRSTATTANGYVDVNDDGKVSVSDALQVIKGLRSKATPGDTDWVRVSDENNSRVGVRMKSVDDGSVEIEVRLQNAPQGEVKEILIDDQWIGSITADAKGRGTLKIESNKELADRMAELLLQGRSSTTLTVDSSTQVELKSPQLSESRSAENQRLIDGSVFTASLNSEGQSRGEVLYTTLGEREFLGFYARGLTADQSYEIKINGVVVANEKASSRGVIAKRIDVASIADFPTISTGTVIEISNYRGEFVSLRERLQIPKSFYIANLSGNGLVGSGELLLSNDRTIIGLRLFRVAANQVFSIFVDSVKIAEATSGPRGFLDFRFDSSRGDRLLASLPTITAESVIKVGEVASGKLLKLGS